VGKAELLQNRSDIALVKVDVETLLDDALQIDAPPAHDAVAGAVGTRFNERGEFGFSLRRQTGLDATGVAIQKPVGPQLIETMNPVAQRLPIHAADPGRVGPVHAIQNRRQR
jgi:hypothetical protein